MPSIESRMSKYLRVSYYICASALICTGALAFFGYSYTFGQRDAFIPRDSGSHEEVDLSEYSVALLLLTGACASTEVYFSTEDDALDAHTLLLLRR